MLVLGARKARGGGGAGVSGGNAGSVGSSCLSQARMVGEAEGRKFFTKDICHKQEERRWGKEEAIAREVVAVLSHSAKMSFKGEGDVWHAATQEQCSSVRQGTTDREAVCRQIRFMPWCYAAGSTVKCKCSPCHAVCHVAVLTPHHPSLAHPVLLSSHSRGTFG